MRMHWSLITLQENYCKNPPLPLALLESLKVEILYHNIFYQFSLFDVTVRLDCVCSKQFHSKFTDLLPLLAYALVKILLNLKANFQINLLLNR